MATTYTRSNYKAPALASGMARQAPPLEAFLHHTADAEGMSFNTKAEQVAKVHAIDRQHRNQGWSMGGYHWVVFQKVESRNEARAFQLRPARFVPAAQAGRNTRTLAIVVVGNGDREPLHADTQDAIVAVLRMYQAIRTLGGHRDVVSTACPGARFYARVPGLAQRAGLRRFR